MSDREIRYARSGEVSVAYQTVGDGPRDLVFVTGFTMPFEAGWDYPPYRRFIERLATFSRVIMFDKRGIGFRITPKAHPLSSKGSTTFAPSWMQREVGIPSCSASPRVRR